MVDEDLLTDEYKDDTAGPPQMQVLLGMGHRRATRRIADDLEATEAQCHVVRPCQREG